MADDVTIQSGTITGIPANTKIATDDVSGTHYQKVKLALGADGAEDNVVDSGQQLSAASVPVVLASDHSDIKVTLDSETVVLAAGTNNVGDVDVASQVASSFDHGSNRDVDTSAEQITSSSIAAKFGVTVRADPSNTGIIYVGSSDVTAGTTDATDGFPLQAGESITLPVNNANLVYVIASAANQIVYWVAC